MSQDKKVRFSGVNKVYNMLHWDFAYRQARLSLWEQDARDRVRFRRRIEELAPELNRILESNHRNSVYEKLYVPREKRDFMSKVEDVNDYWYPHTVHQKKSYLDVIPQENKAVLNYITPSKDYVKISYKRNQCYGVHSLQNPITDA